MRAGQAQAVAQDFEGGLLQMILEHFMELVGLQALQMYQYQLQLYQLLMQLDLDGLQGSLQPKEAGRKATKSSLIQKKTTSIEKKQRDDKTDDKKDDNNDKKDKKDKEDKDDDGPHVTFAKGPDGDGRNPGGGAGGCGGIAAM